LDRRNFKPHFILCICALIGGSISISVRRGHLSACLSVRNGFAANTFKLRADDSRQAFKFESQPRNRRRCILACVDACRLGPLRFVCQCVRRTPVSLWLNRSRSCLVLILLGGQRSTVLNGGHDPLPTARGTRSGGGYCLLCPINTPVPTLSRSPDGARFDAKLHYPLVFRLVVCTQERHLPSVLEVRLGRVVRGEQDPRQHPAPSGGVGQSRRLGCNTPSRYVNQPAVRQHEEPRYTTRLYNICRTLVARRHRQLIGPADWVFVTLGPLRCD